MQLSKVILVLFLSIIFYSYADTFAADLTAQYANASFSAVIDGKAVSGKGADIHRTYNVAYRATSDIGPILVCELWDSTKNSRNEYNYAFKLSFPEATGKKTVAPDSSDDEKYGITVIINTDPAHMMKYDEDSLTLEITSITKTEVSGTFSGKFSADTRTGKKEITVTDGKFDIPILPPVIP